MSESLYRKYRAQSFEQLYGQGPIQQTLKEAVRQKKCSHAYLFTGPRGTGKTSTARILAKAINCKKPLKDGNPCNTCSPCKAIVKGRYLDLIEIDAASNRGIDEIRVLKDQVNFSPTEGAFKVYIIDEVHMLTNEAFNALLKTIEEPPAHAIFILATTEPHKVPATIISRCQRFDFKLANKTDLGEKLQFIVDQEKRKISPDALDIIIRLGMGSFRDAETILEKIITTVTNKEISAKDVEMVLGLADNSQIENLLELSLKGDGVEALSLLHQLYDEGIDVHRIFSQLLELLRERLLESFDRKELISPIIFAVKVFSDAEFRSRKSSNPILCLEIAIVEVAQNLQKVEETSVPFVKNQKPLHMKKSKPVSKKIENTSEKDSIDTKKNPNIITIKKKWGSLLNELRSFNHHLVAFLQKSEPLDVIDNMIHLKVPFQFHKDRIEQRNSQDAFAQASTKIFGLPLRPSCELVTGSSKVHIEPNEETVLEVFGEILQD